MLKASKSIKPLLDEAVKVIPEDEIHLSRITLKATAGLRLIPEKAAIKILKDVSNFNSNIFRIKHHLQLNLHLSQIAVHRKILYK